MKKFFLLAMAAVAMTFTACKNEPAAPAQPEEPQAEEVVLIETDSIAKVIEAADSTQLSSLLTTVQEQIESLKNTDPAKAKEYLATIQNFLKENADKVKAFVGDNAAVNAAVSALTAVSAEEVVNNFMSSVGDAANNAVEGAKDAVEGAVDNAKDAANKAVEDAKAATVDKANEAVNDAKEKAGKAVDDAAAAAKKSLGL